MNINIILSIDNEIVKTGMNTIIQNGILGSNVLCINKSEVISKIELNFFEIAIVEIGKNYKIDYDLINKLVAYKNKTKIFVLSNNNLSVKILKTIKSNDIELILDNYTVSSIIEQIKFNILYFRDRNSFRTRKTNKLKSLNNLLSIREFEIGNMLINGESISNIATKKKLALSTVSTYKRRIFEKTKVKNILEMEKLFKQTQVIY